MHKLFTRLATCLSPAPSGHSVCRAKSYVRLSAKERHLPHATAHASTPTMHHSTSIKAIPARAPALPRPWVPRRIRARVTRTTTLAILSVIYKMGAEMHQNIHLKYVYS